MALERDTTPEARRVQLDVLKRLGGPPRLAMALEMSEYARAVSEAGIRHRHPDWSDREVQRAIVKLLLGPDLARRIDAAQADYDP